MMSIVHLPPRPELDMMIINIVVILILEIIIIIIIILILIIIIISDLPPRPELAHHVVPDRALDAEQSDLLRPW